MKVGDILNRTILTKILVESDVNLWNKWLENLKMSHRIQIISKPQKILVMAKARDSVTGQPFYLGEILATECTVKVDDYIGFGILMGDNPHKAYVMAVIDAAFNGKLLEFNNLLPHLIKEEEKISKRQKMSFHIYLRPK